jgi:putative DNA modification/repair radical SAM protein
MTLEEKLSILGESAKYDVSCASSGSERSSQNGPGSTVAAGICHSWAADGRCISLLKVLLSNSCIYDCLYCVNRSSNDIKRVAFTADEVADLTIQFYRRNYIEGLFLSSGVMLNPDHTMELLIKAVSRLRNHHRFNGYIHVKLIPGASSELVRQAAQIADRISVNIELPTSGSLKLLAPQKSKESILTPMRQARNLREQSIDEKDERKNLRHAPNYNPAGMSTQLIVGASPESDLVILNLAENLYQKINLKRVYYSAYMSVNQNSKLPAPAAPPLLREHRLYQADWLLRFYGFKSTEILDEDNPDLDPRFDPKTVWALRHPEYFPVDVHKADYRQLLRIPGVGVRSARRILQARKVSSLDEISLKKLGVVLKRARYFTSIHGKYLGPQKTEPAQMERLLLASENSDKSSHKNSRGPYKKQAGLFDNLNDNFNEAPTINR